MLKHVWFRVIFCQSVKQEGKWYFGPQTNPLPQIILHPAKSMVRSFWLLPPAKLFGQYTKSLMDQLTTFRQVVVNHLMSCERIAISWFCSSNTRKLRCWFLDWLLRLSPLQIWGKALGLCKVVWEWGVFNEAGFRSGMRRFFSLLSHEFWCFLHQDGCFQALRSLWALERQQSRSKGVTSTTLLSASVRTPWSSSGLW